ncbi:MAG: hypothetical protein AB7T08_11025 [Hyphomonadaceae bacterium]
MDLLFVALLQAAAGEPQPAPAPPATEQTQPSEPAAAETPAEDPDLDRVVCRTEQVVGSRLGRRVCMTRRERLELRRQQQQRLNEGTRPIGQPSVGN